MFNSDPNNKDTLMDDIIEVGAITAGVPAYAYVNNKYQGSSLQETFRKYGSKLPGSDYLNNQLNRSISTTSGQLLSTAEQSLQKTLMSQLMMLEEMSPLHILRTLQLSNFIQPFTELSNNNEMIHISGRSVRNQEHYYRSLIDYVNKDNKQKVKRALQNRDLTRGMFYQNGNIYGATKEGLLNKDDLIFRNAKLALSTVKNGDIYSPNHIVEKFANVIGSRINKDGAKLDPITIVAGKTGKDFAYNWGKSTLRFSMEVGFKTLDNPVAGIEEMLHGVGANYTGIFENKVYKSVKDRLNIGFGTNGRYDLGVRESLKISAKNIAVKGAGLYLGYEVLDSALRTLSPEGGLFDKGVATGLANIYASSRIAFAEMWSDRFQGYKEKQEQNAPGSTSLTKLLAFPLAGALLGSQLAYFGRVGVASVKGTEKAASVFNVESESKFLKNFGINTKLKPMKKNALIGGLVGGAFTLPFLPGALIGTSSEELKELYSGKTDVAEKANRFWMFCLPPNQPVPTRIGLKDAECVSVGDELLDRFGNYNRVKAISVRDTSEEVFNIKVVGGLKLDNRMTGEHPVLTDSGWVKAKYIKKGDILIAPKYKTNETFTIDLTDNLKDILPNIVWDENYIYNTQISGASKEKKRVTSKRGSFPKDLDLTPMLGLLFGWFLAEGNLSQNNTVEFTFHITEVEFAKNIAEYVKTIFNVNYNIINVTKNTCRLRISSTLLVGVFRLFFFNGSSNFKKFPDLSQTNKEFIRNFIIGLYYGDGDISQTFDDRRRGLKERTKIRLTTSKLDHVIGLKNILTLWDIYPSVLKETRLAKFPNGSSGVFTNYRVISEGVNAKKLNDIGVYKQLTNYYKATDLKQNKQKPNYWFDENHLYIKVSEIVIENYKGLVYDYNVENAHEFQLPSFIVHNSGRGLEWQSDQIFY